MTTSDALRQKVRSNSAEQRALVAPCCACASSSRARCSRATGPCGKAGCACQRGALHGPYYVLSASLGRPRRLLLPRRAAAPRGARAGRPLPGVSPRHAAPEEGEHRAGGAAQALPAQHDAARRGTIGARIMTATSVRPRNETLRRKAMALAAFVVFACLRSAPSSATAGSCTSCQEQARPGPRARDRGAARGERGARRTRSRRCAPTRGRSSASRARSSASRGRARPCSCSRRPVARPDRVRGSADLLDSASEPHVEWPLF